MTQLLDITGIYPSQRMDFEGRTVAALDRALVREGMRVTTLVLRPWLPLWLARHLRPYRHLAVASGVSNDRGVEVVVTRHPRIPRLPERWRFDVNVRLAARHALRRCRELGRSFDLVHVQGLAMAPVANLVAAELGLPLTVTLRDDLGHVDGAALRPLERRVFDRTAAFFVIGPKLHRDLARILAGREPPSIELAPNGIDVEEIEGLLASSPSPGPASEAGRRFGRIVSVANLYRLKGLHEALRALAIVRDRGLEDWRYTVVGDGPYRDELRELAVKLGLDDRVSFTGRLSHAAALDAIRRADIFLLPSWMEAFGNVYAEAAVCGLPAIGCLDNGPELIIEADRTGILVPPRDVPALAGAIERLLADPEAARRMGAAARRHIRSFTWERTAGIYRRTFSRLAQAEGTTDD